MASSTSDPALDALWATYRTWAATAQYYKKAIDDWSFRTLWLAIIGALVATLGQQLSVFDPQGGNVWFKAPGVLGAILIALASYFTAQMLTGDREKIWLKSRSAAESLKSIVYLYRASAAPFDGPGRLASLQARIDSVTKSVKEVTPRVAEVKAIPSGAPLSVQQYVSERVDDQITWYNKRALEFQKKADDFRIAVFGLGALSVVLGGVAAVFPVSSWLAVIATGTTAITAYVKNRRYQGSIALYAQTAMQLNLLKGTWANSGRTEADKADRDAFIQRCEETMSLENGSWVAQWSEQQPGQADAAVTS